MPGWTALRGRVLREPLGLHYTAVDFDEEKDDLHLVGTIDGQVVGGLLVRTAGQPDRVWKIRQLAVDPDFQKSGHGSQLMAAAETAARDRSIAELVLHSRETVVGFYEKLGFESEGEQFEEVGLPHRRMRKGLR